MIHKYLSYSSLTLGLLTLIYSTYVMVAFTSGYDRSFTAADFLSSFFMAMGIISFGLYVDVQGERPTSAFMKSNRRYRLTVLGGLFLLCLAFTVYVLIKL